MKILKAKVDPMEKYANAPSLELLVDKIPEIGPYQTFVVDNDTFYFQEVEGYVRFLVHRPDNENGFYGDTFKILTTDDQEIAVKGPWSSRCSVVGPIFDTPCREVSITDNPEAFERGFTFFAGAVTEELFREGVWMAEGDWLVEWQDRHGEQSLEIVPVWNEERWEAFMQRLEDDLPRFDSTPYGEHWYEGNILDFPKTPPILMTPYEEGR